MSARIGVDKWMFFTTMLLVVVGLAMVFSASAVVAQEQYHSEFASVGRQALWALAGLLALFVLMHVDYTIYKSRKFIYGALCVTTLLLVFVFLIPGSHNTHRWIRFGGQFTFQPSEIAKPVLVLFLAWFLHTRLDQMRDWKHTLLRAAIMPVVFILLIVKQPDLGTASILVLVFLTIAALTRVRWQSVAFAVASAGPAVYLFFTLQALGYQQSRIKAFFNPEADIKGIGYHAHHARVAIGDGGLLGSGLGMGTQNRFGFIPDQYTDFPFPVFAEEWGFVGCVVLICLYGFVSVWSIHVASQAKDRFGAVLAVGWRGRPSPPSRRASVPGR